MAMDRTTWWQDEEQGWRISLYRGVLSASLARSILRDLETGIPWELHDQSSSTRFTAWTTAKNCKCAYTYGQHRVRPLPFKEHWEAYQLMGQVLQLVMKGVSPYLPQFQWPNSANLNLYPGKDDCIPWHSDDENIFGGPEDDKTIVSLSLGAPRRFCMRRKTDKAAWYSVELWGGDVLVMQGSAQRHLEHCTLKDVGGPRINITWRRIRFHTGQCSNTEDEEQPRAQLFQ